jgi:hypothetical protein
VGGDLAAVYAAAPSPAPAEVGDCGDTARGEADGAVAAPADITAHSRPDGDGHGRDWPLDSVPPPEAAILAIPEFTDVTDHRTAPPRAVIVRWQLFGRPAAATFWQSESPTARLPGFDPPAGCVPPPCAGAVLG